MNKAFTAKAVVVVCDVKLHRAAVNSFGFSKNKFYKSINTIAFISTDLFLYLTIKIF